ncbi:MAG: glycosyltransferase [Thermacetogeniaceae bacterium]
MRPDLPLSLCMIVRDEEQRLASCLSSVRPLVREIVVVDTGSADRTKEVAAAFGARVYDFCWNDDFAAARNYALDLATEEWVLVMDADEILEPLRPEDMARLLAADGIEGYFVTVRSYLDALGCEAVDDVVVRLFRNKPFYRFEGAIHEQIAGTIKRHNMGRGLAHSHLLIHHMGYLSREIERKEKRKRNITVIAKALVGHPSDPFLHYSLGLEYLLAGRAAEGIDSLEKALSLMKGDEGYCRDLYVALGLALLKTGSKDELAELLGKAFSLYPDDPELALVRGLLHFSEGRHDRAIDDLRLCMEERSDGAPRSLVSALLGEAYSGLGCFEDALQEYCRALRSNPMQLYPLTRILGLARSEGVAVDWGYLSGFASLEVKRCLREQLARMGEASLAAVLSLLMVVEVLDKNEEGGLLLKVSREHLDLLAGCRGGGASWDYLVLAAKELVIAAEVSQRWPRLAHVLGLVSWSGARRLAVASLEMAVKAIGSA